MPHLAAAEGRAKNVYRARSRVTRLTPSRAPTAGWSAGFLCCCAQVSRRLRLGVKRRNVPFLTGSGVVAVELVAAPGPEALPPGFADDLRMRLDSVRFAVRIRRRGGSKVFEARPLDYTLTATPAASLEKMTAAQNSMDQGSDCAASKHASHASMQWFSSVPGFSCAFTCDFLGAAQTDPECWIVVLRSYNGSWFRGRQSDKIYRSR